MSLVLGRIVLFVRSLVSSSTCRCRSTMTASMTTFARGRLLLVLTQRFSRFLRCRSYGPRAHTCVLWRSKRTQPFRRPVRLRSFTRCGSPQSVSFESFPSPCLLSRSPLLLLCSTPARPTSSFLALSQTVDAVVCVGCLIKVSPLFNCPCTRTLSRHCDTYIRVADANSPS